MKRFALALTGIALPLAAAWGASLLHACVPADTRPAPGMLTFTVSPSPAVMHGVVTADGWTLRFERVLLAIGNATIAPDCTRYSESNYDRVLDVTSMDHQELSILFGIGRCDVRFRIQPPSSDAVLGAGVTEDDKTRMRTGGGDRYTTLSGIAVDITGSASLGATTKHFHFSFRPRLRYHNCSLVPDAAIPTEQEAGVDLESNDAFTYDVRIEAEALFRDGLSAAATSLRFDPFARADMDGDGNISLDELRQIPMTALGDAGGFGTGTYGFDEDAGVMVNGKAVPIETFEDYVYILLLPTIARFRDTGSCTTDLSFTSPP